MNNEFNGKKLNAYGVYYMRPAHFRDLNFGDILPTLARLGETHALLKITAAYDLEHLFEIMNIGWNQDGSENERIRARGLGHSSMSVGDVARLGDRYWVCRPCGWEEILK